MYNGQENCQIGRIFNINGYSPISSSDDQQTFSYQSSSGRNIDQSYHQQLQQSQQQSTSQLQAQHHQQQRYGHFSRHSTMASSLAAIGDSMSEIVIDDLQNESEPTSAILDFCKRKFLCPYVTILSLVGLHPINTDATFCRTCLSHLQALVVLLILCFGYFLQYLSSFRGDRGFTNALLRKSTQPKIYFPTDKQSLGEMIFVYIIPNGLHLAGFVSAMIVFKIADNEHLQNLVERVFLMSTRPKRVCVILWFYVLAAIVWLGLLLAYVLLFASTRDAIIQSEIFGEANENLQYAAKILLVVSVFTHDTIQIIILMTYSIECLLLRIHMVTLSEKLMQHTIESIDWMREVLEFRKLLTHLNNRVALPVCFFIVMNLSYAFAGLIYLFKEFDFNNSPVKLVALNVSNVILWLIMGLLPFFQAAALTRVCATARTNGHHIRVRPFVYHHSTSEDLNSTLLFASSLSMSAKLFRMPVQGNYLCFAILVISIIILTLGMCVNLSLGIF